ncbi:MAG TPA: hypothetical protein DIW52_23395 [Pseudomonas sp.]|nr:hypothetical protein [Pseudomonas sp.]
MSRLSKHQIFRFKKKHPAGCFFCACDLCRTTNPLVGASLLAKASSHPAMEVADTPLSRAGSLPQLIGGVVEGGFQA